MVLRTLNLVLTLSILAIVAFAVFRAIQVIQDAGGLTSFFEDLGSGTVSAGTGFLTGAVSGLFNFGKDVGSRFNPFD